MTRVCLVGVDSCLMPKSSKGESPVNGEAIQQALLARALRDLGLEVCAVFNTRDGDIDEVVDGIRLRSAFNRHAGIPVVRFLYPRATGVFRALIAVDADVYMQSPAGALTGLTAAFCQWKKRKFIFRVASDVDCVPGKQLIMYRRDRRIFEYGLKHADALVVQSKLQKQLLEKNYGLKSTVVNMVVERPGEDLDVQRDIDVLWISNLNPIKRADRVLALASQMADVRFTIIGGVVSGNEAYYVDIERKAAMLPNVSFLGQMSYRTTNQYLARSKLFLNTSDIEGFPNTFLQAWVRKVPVVSFFDPDGIIERERLGRRAESEDEMRIAIRELLRDTESRNRIGNGAYEYAFRNFSPSSTAKRYLKLIKRLDRPSPEL